MSTEIKSKREQLADAIEANGGYISGYRDGFAIQFNVALYWANLDKDHIYKRVVEGYGEVPMSPLLEWDANEIWSQVQEEMYDRLNDDDAQRSYSRATAVAYGLTHDENYFDVTFELHGRGGKHLVVESFEGIKLNRSCRDFVSDLRDDDGTEFNEVWCNNLLAMLGEWGGMFTQKKASDEMEYLAAYRMHQRLEEFHDVVLKHDLESEIALSEGG